MRTAKIRTSLQKHALSPESLLLRHTNYGRRWMFSTNFKLQAPLDILHVCLKSDYQYAMCTKISCSGPSRKRNIIMGVLCFCCLDISIGNSYTMGCPPVRGDNPRALASGLSYVQVDKHGITILYHLHQCRPCTSRDISC